MSVMQVTLHQLLHECRKLTVIKSQWVSVTTSRLGLTLGVKQKSELQNFVLEGHQDCSVHGYTHVLPSTHDDAHNDHNNNPK